MSLYSLETITTLSLISPTCIEILEIKANYLTLRILPWGTTWVKRVTKMDFRGEDIIALGKKHGDGGEHLVRLSQLLALIDNPHNCITNNQLALFRE